MSEMRVLLGALKILPRTMLHHSASSLGASGQSMLSLCLIPLSNPMSYYSMGALVPKGLQFLPSVCQLGHQMQPQTIQCLFPTREHFVEAQCSPFLH